MRRRKTLTNCDLGYIAFNLSEATIEKLRQAFPPRHERFICRHATVTFGVRSETPLPQGPFSLEVIGYTDDGLGVEALVVKVDGDLRRPDGGIYHITHSLAAGRNAVESNEVIVKLGWELVEQPVAVTATLCWNPL